MTRPLLILISLLCLTLISAPAFAAPDLHDYPADHPSMELAGDVAAILAEVVADKELLALLDKSERKALARLMDDEASEGLIHIGQVRAKAKAAHKPLPGFAKIKNAEAESVAVMLQWSEAAYEFIQQLQDTLQDNRDALSELGEEQQLRMQLLMERMSQADAASSNLMKKLAETQSQIISNFK